MSRRSRPHMPPRQSRLQLPQGGVALDQVEDARKQQEMIMRQRVDQIAVALYSQFVDPDCVEGFESHCAEMARMSVDAALVFMREIWGVQGQRVVPSQPPASSRPPQPIIEE